MIIGIPVYDDVDMFDVTGPFEMFDWAGFEIDLLAAEPGMKKFRSRGFAYSVTRGFAQARAYDAIWVPGGEPAALAGIIDDPARTYLDFLVAQAGRVPMMCAVCDGAMLLAAAGLLDGYRATTHWEFLSCFPQLLPKVIVAPRPSEIRPRPRPVDRRRHLVGPGRGAEIDRAVGRHRARPEGPAERAILPRPAGQQRHPAIAGAVPDPDALASGHNEESGSSPPVAPVKALRGRGI